MLDHLKKLKFSFVELAIGAALAASAMMMTYKGGRSMDVSDPSSSQLIGIACALISAVVAIGLHIVDKHKAKGDLAKAKSYQQLWYAALVFEICAAALFTVSHRAANVSQAMAQDAKFQTIGTIATDKRKSLETLQGELEAFQVANPWSLTTEASGLEADLKLATDRADYEASLGGCKSKCIALKAKATDIKVRIGALAKRNELTAKMDSLKTQVEQTATAAATADRGGSGVLEASAMFASFGTLSLEPGKEAIGWANNVTGLVMSIIFSIAAAMILRDGLSEYLPHTATRSGYTPDIDHEPVQTPRPAPKPITKPASDTTEDRTTVIERHFSNNGLTREAIADAMARQGLLRAA